MPTDYNTPVRRERVGATLAEILANIRAQLQAGNTGTGSGTGGGVPVPPTGGDVTPVGQTGPDQPPDPNAANNASVTPSADNGLLWLGGLALFAAIAWPRKVKQLTGIPSAKWMLPAAGVAAVVLYYKFKKPSRAEMTTAINAWASSTGATGVADFMGIVSTMPDDDLETTWEYVTKYISKGVALTASDPFYSKLQALATKYQIFN